MAERNQIDKGLFTQPATANDKLLAKIADMRDRTTKRADAELGEDAKHFERRARAPVVAGGRLLQIFSLRWLVT
jgi:hypothetical protein